MTPSQRRRRRQTQRRNLQQQLAAQRTASTRRRVQRRAARARALKGATEFSGDRLLSDPVAVISMFKQWAPATCASLITRTQPITWEGRAGAPRMEGSWALVFLAHIMDGNPDWQNWYHRNRDSLLWQECGFHQVPAFNTVYKHFCELEDPRCRLAFEDAAYVFVRIAARHVPEAFNYVHIDGTPAHSHSRLTHACPDREFCRSRQGWRVPKELARASEEAINEDRHKHSAEPEPEQPDTPPSNRLRRLDDEEAQELGCSDVENSAYYEAGENGHILRCLDKEAGVRAYTAGGRARKVWIGGYFMPAVSDYFGAPFALHFFRADVQEHLGWPALERKIAYALNEDPDNPTRHITAVVADRAFTNQTFIAYNTHRGIASVTPERKLPGGREFAGLRDPEGLWDEHGPRCRYCGGPSAPYRGAGEGFAINGAGDPRLSYRCNLGFRPECRNSLQTISCTREYRSLLPIGRRERIFHDLLSAHSNKEAVFDSWRDRYAVSGNANANRSKRRGSIAAQELRGAAALLAEWFRICVRHGYIGNHDRLNTNQPEVRTGGERRFMRMRRYRQQHGLDLPMGPRADELNLQFPPAAPAADTP